MAPEVIQAALIGRLSGVGDALRPALPNRDHVPARPYVEILPFMADRVGGTLRGGEILRETGRMALNVVVAVDTGTEDANAWAATIVGLFPEGLRVRDEPDGAIVIHRPPDVRGGFRDGPDWKVPVVVHFEAFS